MGSIDTADRCEHCAGKLVDTHWLTVAVGEGKEIKVHDFACAVGWLVEQREADRSALAEARLLAEKYAGYLRVEQGRSDWREAGHPRDKMPWEAQDGGAR